MSKLYAILNYSLVIIFFLAHSGLKTQEVTYLEKGLIEKEAGNYAAALEIWEEARTVLENPSLSIAKEHIQLVTEQKIKNSYQIASAMYFWGLTASEIDRSVLEEEMKMLEPIVNPDVYKRWRKAFKEQPETVLPLIQEFWIYQDFTPDTPYNERLMEHWERIAYARENFTKDDITIYGTDDRGIGWIQFGEPNIIHKGNLHISASNVEDVVIKKFCTISPGCSIGPIQRAYARNIALAAVEFGQIFRKYEIWVYTTHDISPLYNNVLIFGDTAIKGFARALSVNDFIPPSAATFSKRFAIHSVEDVFDFEMTPAVFMQHEYLEQLAGIDPQFGQAFGNFLFDFFKVGEPARKEQTFRYKREQVQKAIQIRNAAPEEVSIYEEVFPSIPVDTYHYRFLTDDNKPYSLVYLESQPQGLFILDSSRNSEVMFSDSETSAQDILSYYDFTHGLQIRGKDQKLLASQKLTPPITIDAELVPPSVSIFRVPYVSPNTWNVFYAELKNNFPDTKPEINSPFPNELRGIGTIKQKQGESLSTDLTKLTLSDVIIGHNLDPNDDGTTFIPFEVTHSKEIPKGQNLAIHYELYHLQQDVGGIARFEIDIEVVERKRGINRLRDTTPNFTLTLNQQSDRSLFKENLEIETSDLEEGNYVLKMLITDTITNQVIDKKINFSIIK